MSKLSSATTNVKEEASDLNSSNYPLHTKRPRRHDSNVSSSRFTGVIGQMNGHWGAQIYANHKRIWLGSFKSEQEAAMAYDSAAIKLRNGDSFRNYPWTSITAHELNFQSKFSTEVVLTMIKDGSYPSKSADYLQMQFRMGEMEVVRNSASVHGNGGFFSRQLFQKELTSSDVSNLNRLVIPKKNALKHFPRIYHGAKKIEAGGKVDDTQLVFYDRFMRSWKFRYCYWKSSQTFVFTKGWNKFVKEKELKVKDMIVFSLCEYGDETNTVRTFCMIDVCYHDGVESNSGSGGEEISEDAEACHGGLGENAVDSKEEVELNEEAHQHDLRQNIDDTKNVKELKGEKELVGAESTDQQQKGLRLFGVQIL